MQMLQFQSLVSYLIYMNNWMQKSTKKSVTNNFLLKNKLESSAPVQ